MCLVSRSLGFCYCNNIAQFGDANCNSIVTCNNILHVVTVRRSINTEIVYRIVRLTLSLGMQTEPIVQKVRGLYTRHQDM